MPIKVLRETHETPEEVSRVLRIAGGLNPFGEPNYRAVWGGSRLDWIGGKWEDRDETDRLERAVIELRREPKYPQLNRWHIERWVPPESYGSPELWRLQTMEREDGIFVPALGPFPSRGDYEHCFTLESPSGDYLQLTPAIAREIALAIELSRNLPRMSRRERISKAESEQDRRYDSYADSVFNEGSTITGPMVAVP